MGYNKIQEMLQFLTDTKDKKGKTGIVKNVDAESLTCDVEISDDVIIYDVRLSSLSNSDFAIIPKIESQVSINYLDNIIPFVVSYSEVEQILMKTQTDSLLEIINDLIDAILQMTLSTNQGATIANGVINKASFELLKNRNKKMFRK